MSWSHIAGVYVNGNGSSAAINVVGATLFIGSVSYSPGSLGATPISDSQSNTWIDVGTTYQSGGNPRAVRVFYCINPSTSSSQTFRTNTASYGSLAVETFACNGTPSFFNQTGQGNFSDSSPGNGFQAGSLSPSTPNDLFAFTLGLGGSNGTSVDSGFTAGVRDNGSSICAGVFCYKIKSSDSSAENPTWTNSANSYGGATQLVFVEPSVTPLFDTTAAVSQPTSHHTRSIIVPSGQMPGRGLNRFARHRRFDRYELPKAA